MVVNFDALPADIQQGKRFCCWRAIPDKGKPKKIQKRPWRADGVGLLTWSNPLNLLSFDEVKSLYLTGQDLPEHNGKHFAGIGYILNGTSDLVCVDLDSAIDDRGKVKPEAHPILERLNSYTEISPSGEGLHIWVKAQMDGPNIPQIALAGQKIEIFVRSHHVTLTGDVLPGYERLESRQAETEALYYKLQAIQGRPKDAPKNAPKAHAEDNSSALKYVAKALEYEAKAVRDEPEGNRNNRLNEAAFSIGRYAGAGLISEGEVERTLLSAALVCGLDDSEARATIQSGSRAGVDNPVYPDLPDLEGRAKDEELQIEVDTEHFSEGGNASRLIRLHGQDMRYCHTFRKWLIWDGRHWKLDGNGEAMRLASDIVQDLYIQAANAGDSDTRKKCAAFAQISDSRHHLKNVLDLASNRLPLAITADVLDINTWLAIAGDVTINLKTLETREPSRSDLITKTFGTHYDQEASCPRWEMFLSEIFAGNEELINYIKRAVGYSLTGSMQEQVFFFLHGTGANGKSTFLAVLRALMGDYARQASFSTFLAQRAEKVRNDLASLAGVRVVTAAEAEEGSRFSMATIKPWVGQDPFTARFLFGEDFTFRPEGKIWLAANTKPTISERAYAAWRRVHLVPFNVSILKENQDPNLESKLLDELPGILNWALDGLREYHAIGLAPPKEVLAATNEYRRENDSLQGFIGECCTIAQLSICRNSDLFGEYQKYCKDSGHEPLSQKKFSEELKLFPGLSQTRDNQGLIWRGIGLVHDGVGSDHCAVQDRSKMDVSSIYSPRVENFAQNPTHPTHPTPNSDFTQDQACGGGKGTSDKQKQKDADVLGSKSKPKATNKLLIRIIKEYPTQIVDPNDSLRYINFTYKPGQIIEVERWKAEDLIERGIAELVNGI
jgi:putative DNA primase/helicase